MSGYDTRLRKPVARRKLFKAVLLFLLLCPVLLGCAQKAETPDLEAEPRRRLLISAVTDENVHYTTVPTEERSDNTLTEITYYGLSEVMIDVNGASVPLETAIRDGAITLPELFAFARIDAQNGICTESYVSEHGLTHFCYTYPEFEIELAYDVLETPDGNQYLIEDVCVSRVTPNNSRSYFYVDEDSEWGYFLDREDWGLTFEVENAASTGLTLKCTQFGGQQIGELVVGMYTLYLGEDNGNVPTLEGNGSSAQNQPETAIAKDASTVITIDWAEIYGELASGDYRIRLTVSDVYDESQVHPLMEDFYDRQSYWIEFSIP